MTTAAAAEATSWTQPPRSLASFASTFWELSHAFDSEVDRGDEICRSAARLVPNKNSTEPSATRSSSSTEGASEAFMPGVISCMRLAKPPCLCQFGRADIRLLETARKESVFGLR